MNPHPHGKPVILDDEGNCAICGWPVAPDIQAALATVREALDEWYIPDSQYHAALALIESELQSEQDEAFFKGGGMSAKERINLEARIEALEAALREFHEAFWAVEPWRSKSTMERLRDAEAVARRVLEGGGQ